MIVANVIALVQSNVKRSLTLLDPDEEVGAMRDFYSSVSPEYPVTF